MKKRIRTKNPDKSKYYVDNEKFLNEMIKYKIGKKEDIDMEYIGDCFMKISRHLSFSPSFINYTYREDMVSDGVENCLLYMNNFNSEISKNPFSYFTQIIYYAFIRRIQREKKQMYLKYKWIELHETTDPTYRQIYVLLKDHIDKMNIEEERKKKKKKRMGLEMFYTSFEEDIYD